MKSLVSMKRVFLAALLVVACMCICFILAVYWLSANGNLLPASYGISAIVLSTGFLIVAGALCWALKKRMLALLSSINQVVDQIPSGTVDLDLFEDDSALSKFSDKLKRLYEVQRHKYEQSKRQSEQIQSYISDISHQVRLPLTNIKMYCATLLEHEHSAEEQKPFLTYIQQQIDKLDFLLQSMIKLSRLESGIMTLAPTVHPVYETIASSLGEIYPLAQRKNIQIQTDCDEELCAFHDSKWTSEVIFNLLDNAVKYTPPGGTIKLRTHRYEFFSCVTIQDNGIGIDPGHLNLIFKRFYREPNVQQTQGVGLGLYLVRKILSMEGGYATVESQLQQGSKFSVFLPVKPSVHSI